MHLLFFVQYFPPEKASGLTIITDLLEGFADHGWKIDVYVPMPTRGVSDELRKKYYKKRVETLRNGNITIHRMLLYREGEGLIQRTIRYTIFSMQCLIRGLLKPADAIFTGAAPPTQGLIGVIIRKLTKKKFIYNPQDLFPDSLIIAGKTTERSIMARIGRAIEFTAYKNADLIVTISENMANRIKSRTANKDKVKVVYNWGSIETIFPIERKNNRLFDEFGLDRNGFYVTYAGNIGMLQKIETIVLTAKSLQDIRGISFLIFGDGSEKEKINKMITDEKIENIKLYPLLSQDRVSEVYSLGDVSVVSCRKGTGKIGMPSKTMTILATGTPVVASFDTDSDLAYILNQYDCGICVEPENEFELAKSIKELYECPERIECMRKKARKCVEDSFCKKKGVEGYIANISNIMNCNA